MKITIQSTTKIVAVKNSASSPISIDCRVWEGVTEHGVKVQALIPRIAAIPEEGQNMDQFQVELKEHEPPSPDVQAWPLRLIL